MISAEGTLWSGEREMERTPEELAAEMQQHLGAESKAEEAEKDEATQHHDDVRRESHREEQRQKGEFKVFGWQKDEGVKTDKKDFRSQHEPHRDAQALKQQQEARVAESRFLSAKTSEAAKAQQLAAAAQLQNKLAGESARKERPPDAFVLLKDARDQGSFFVEHSLAESHGGEAIDPELLAAVEECKALCAGLKGILRIGPGKNDAQEPIILVMTMQGFSDVSLAGVPPQVGRFFTLLVIPFELLPLKVERHP